MEFSFLFLVPLTEYLYYVVQFPIEKSLPSGCFFFFKHYIFQNDQKNYIYPYMPETIRVLQEEEVEEE